ncbi:hypothetical protein GTA08_BOTSDO07581 [Neofusicoccum parvum]|uniref:Uncharacterized protein n=1 Tax=Neofusicoccum parvum TaxID=310453 RepID=A0ACB5RUP9_9PEZI|nr:hypothetical protein GTA08_BOTSDO07581 [Neofusicoccum parvum]GME49847.1 hypothetical protein GTA08_BOTSDO07581 [Neofusicoccum parvum]
MSAAAPPPPPADPAAAALPDYLTDSDAVLKDQGVKWRYGRPPDYSKTRKVYAETKQMNHEAGSLIQLVENLVKNWEIEASFKPRLEDWRTVDHANYTFAINGNPPQSAEHMLKVGTYNAIIAPNEYYSPENSDFASSHKTFKRMMPTFAWEVIEVYSGPPHVSFRWRHWGTMKNDYVGFNDKGEKVTAKAHGGSIDIQGVTVATVDDKVRLQRVETWFDPMEMFRQIAPQGIVNKEPVARRASTPIDAEPEHVQEFDQWHEASDMIGTAQGCEPDKFHDAIEIDHGNSTASSEAGSWTAVTPPASDPPTPRRSTYSSSITSSSEQGQGSSQTSPTEAFFQKCPAHRVHPHPKDMEDAVGPQPGEGVAASPDSEEARLTYLEMSKISAFECPFLMNRE